MAHRRYKLPRLVAPENYYFPSDGKPIHFERIKLAVLPVMDDSGDEIC
jgi:hypothetical protein